MVRFVMKIAKTKKKKNDKQSELVTRIEALVLEKEKSELHRGAPVLKFFEHLNNNEQPGQNAKRILSIWVYQKLQSFKYLTAYKDSPAWCLDNLVSLRKKLDRGGQAYSVLNSMY